jgi:prepilin-type N-terminal cleavage/methylation domain-containing protein
MYNNTRSQLPASRFPLLRAFTLVELLVVMTIMVLLVAASVPMLKPMFDSQKTKNAADTVAAALQRVRFKAMEEQATCGIQFDRFTEGNASNVSLRMRLLKSRGAYINQPNVRVRVENGVIKFYQSASGEWGSSSSIPTPTEWNAHVNDGDSVQFGRQGRFYKLEENSKTKLAPPFEFIPHPNEEKGFYLPKNSTDDAMEFKVLQSPQASLTPPVVLPRGTVVDLEFSSGYFSNAEIPFSNATNGEIKIIFSPAGYIDKFEVNGNSYTPSGGLIYFCVGEWDRQTISSGTTLAEDGKNNIEVPTSFWITIHPKTGQVRITETAPAADAHDVQGARKFAAENY